MYCCSTALSDIEAANQGVSTMESIVELANGLFLMLPAGALNNDYGSKLTVGGSSRFFASPTLILLGTLNLKLSRFFRNIVV